MFLCCLFFLSVPAGAMEAPWETPVFKAPFSAVDVRDAVPDEKPVVSKEEPKPKIALVIDDLGPKRQMTEAFITLPVPVTLSFFPFSPDWESQTERARLAGHTVFLHLPMEPLNNAVEAMMLQTDDDDDMLKDDTNAVLSGVSGYEGVNNHMGSRFTADERAMRVFLTALKERGLPFLDSVTTPDSVAGKVAHDLGVSYIARDVFIDNVLQKVSINAHLALLQQKASEKGFAVGIAHPHQTTLDALKEWIPKAQRDGFEFVSVLTVK